MTGVFKGLNDSQIKRIQANYPTLKKIQQVTGVPWQAMAGIWYRESFSVAPPKTIGGPWQFDPPPNRQRILGLLGQFTKLSENEKVDIVSAGINDFYAGGVIAACFLRTKTANRITPNVSDTVILDAIWGYNGKVQSSAWDSSYTVNGMNSDHYPMRVVGSIPDGHGGRKRIDIEDKRPGAFTIYKQLKTLFP